MFGGSYLARSSVYMSHGLSAQCHMLWDVGGEITHETGKAVKGRTAIEQMDLLFVKIFPCVFCVGWLVPLTIFYTNRYCICPVVIAGRVAGVCCVQQRVVRDTEFSGCCG